MDFVLYFHQSHAWIWFKIVVWESKKSILNCRCPLQEIWNVLTHPIVDGLKLMSILCKTKEKSFDTDSHLSVHERLEWYMTLLKWNFHNIKTVWTKLCRFDAYIHIFIDISLFSPNLAYHLHNACIVLQPLIACVHYFFLFQQMITLKNFEKCFLFHLGSFFFPKIFKFLYFSLPLSLALSAISRGDDWG